ncbi:hypothetical protein [Geodermatophilus sp. SYSU D00815]
MDFERLYGPGGEVFVAQLAAVLDALAGADLHGRGPALLDDTRQLLAL